MLGPLCELSRHRDGLQRRDGVRRAERRRRGWRQGRRYRRRYSCGRLWLMVLASAVPHRRGLQHPSVIIRVHQRLHRRRWRRQCRRLFRAGGAVAHGRGRRPRKRCLSTYTSTATSSSTYTASSAGYARRRRRVRRRRDTRQRQTGTWADATAIGDARGQLERRVLRGFLRQALPRVVLPGVPLPSSVLRVLPRTRWRQTFLQIDANRGISLRMFRIYGRGTPTAGQRKR